MPDFILVGKLTAFAQKNKLNLRRLSLLFQKVPLFNIRILCEFKIRLRYYFTPSFSNLPPVFISDR